MGMQEGRFGWGWRLMLDDSGSQGQGHQTVMSPAYSSPYLELLPYFFVSASTHPSIYPFIHSSAACESQKTTLELVTGSCEPLDTRVGN